MTRTSAAAGGITALGFALAYWMADVALNGVAFSDGWTILWPLNGITIALMLQRPRSTWGVVLLGIENGTGIGEWMDGNALGLEMGLRVCSAMEVLICAITLPRFTDLQAWLRTPGIHVRFVLALAAGPGISGLFAALIYHDTLGQSRLWAFNNWATADALGIAATMPLVLSLRSRHMLRALSEVALWKTISLLLLTLAVSALIFSVSRYPLLFLLYPLLLWIDSVLSFAGSAIAAAGVCFLAVFCTVRGLGPFGTWPATLELPRDLALQLFIGFHLITRLPVSIMLMERRRLAQEGERLSADLRSSNARLTTLATRDGLTGVANRRAFDERFDAEWQRAMEAKRPLTLVILDLDHFKQLNDLYGHAKGDGCLKAVANALQMEARRADDLVARFGGEEFVALLPDTAAASAAEVAERMRSAVLALDIDHAGNLWNRVSVSIGYAVVTPTQDDPKVGLVQLADAALYCAKRAGRNRVDTITSLESLQIANEHFGDTTKLRLRRLLRVGDPADVPVKSA